MRSERHDREQESPECETEMRWAYVGDLGVHEDGSVRYRLMVLWMYHNSPLLRHFRFHCSTRPANHKGERREVRVINYPNRQRTTRASSLLSLHLSPASSAPAVRVAVAVVAQLAELAARLRSRAGRHQREARRRRRTAACTRRTCVRLGSRAGQACPG